MAVKFSNNAKTSLASALNSTATSVSVSDASNFPTLGSGDYTYATIAQSSNSSNLEIVKVTAVSSNTLTVVRAQQGTSALSFSSGDPCEIRVTAGTIQEAITDVSDTLATVATTGAYSDLSGTPTNVSTFTNDSGYLTSFTETNDLSSAVTWANVPDANITQSSVTQHQAALSVTESQISDLGAYITASSTDTLTNKSGNISQWTNDSGYLTSFTETDPTVPSHVKSITTTEKSNWNTAYSWGNHASAGYLTSYTETDPVFSASAASGISSTNISNWNTAYSWGNHASAGYTSTTAQEISGTSLTSSNALGSGTTTSLNDGWYSWGNSPPSNAPDDYSVMWQLSENQPQQWTFSYGGSADRVDLYGRRKTGGTWGNWTKFWNDQDFSSTNVSNWNTAYGWGNHASAGYALASSLSGYVSRNFEDSSRNLVIPTNTTSGSAGLAMETSAGTFLFQVYGTGTQFGFLDAQWGNWDLKKTSGGNLEIDISGTLRTVWHTGNFTSTDVSNWNTAYGWGNHASAGYITNGINYNVNNAWLRENGDNANVKLYGNSRQMAFRTDGQTIYDTGVVQAPFVWLYGGNAGYEKMWLGTSGDLKAYSYQGHSNVAGTGNASYHPSGIYSTGTNWLYGTLYTNNNAIQAGSGSVTCGQINASGSITGTQIYANDWFRNDSAGEGLYNQALNGHFFQASDQYWHLNSKSGATYGGLIIYGAYNASAGNASSRKGYLYWDANGFGLLHSGGGWAVRTTSAETRLYGNVTLNGISEAPSEWNPVLLSDGGIIKQDSAVQIHGAGYLKAQYLNMSHGVEANRTADTIFYSSTDDYIRKTNATNFRTSLNVPTRTGGNASGTWGISITGSAGSVAWSNVTGAPTIPAASPVLSGAGGGQYGSCYVDGGATNGYEGFSIGGRAVFMHNNSTSTGIYNDVNNHWLFYGVHGDATYMYHNGSQKIYTYASGGRVTGNLLATGDVYAYYSDERLKEKTGKIENALDKVGAIETFYYTHNDKAVELGYEGKEQQVGVSAQSVAEVMPEVVHLAPIDDDGEGNSISGENYQTVNYARLVPLLIESIKELRAEIEELKRGV